VATPPVRSPTHSCLLLTPHSMNALHRLDRKT
jgi:hypothetical protein